MIVHINQPRFLPALNYIQRFKIADTFVFLDNVQFQRHSWENRNRIKTPQGEMWLTVPIKKCPLGTPITRAEIDYTQDWQARMLRSIETNYRRAPYFEEFFPRVQQLINAKWRYIFPLNLDIIEFFVEEVWQLAEFPQIWASDLECQGTGEDLLLAICQKLCATTYLSGSEGRNYLNPERWADAGIELRYHDYQPVEYPQQFKPFLPWMSALDLLFNCGRDGRKVLEQFENAPQGKL